MKHKIQFTSKNPPIVEMDSGACAAYVRFSRKKVARTEVIHTGEVEVTMDLDEDDSVVGIELIGVKEFTISSLMEVSGLKVSEKQLKNMAKDARYLLPGAKLATT